ncbi:putative tetratricopeptide-like helical domain superfamily [Helianthus debilis subsp. tardiflorus]
MFSLATKLSTTRPSSSSSLIRSWSTKLHHQFNPNPVALQIIDYAFSLSRSHKSDESYAQGLLVLEQCESNQHDVNSKGFLLLAISTLLSERGNFGGAIEKLNRFNELNVSCFPLRVAAAEALAGLHLELEEDDTSSVIADACLNDLDAVKPELGDVFGLLDARVRALKGLIELTRGNVDSSRTCFEGVQNNLGAGNGALSYAEFLHATRDFSTAKQLYENVIKHIPESKNYSDPYNLAAGNLAREDILMAATCALGQLESHMGNFDDAEKILTQALTMTEERFGPHHPKMGIILTCVALMFRHKATTERSSSLMVQEGLYRRALELLKAPQLETEVQHAGVCGKDIIALARGGYAETLCVQQNRKAVGEQMKIWAEAAWKNQRLSLSEALDISSNPSSKIPIIDARISRAF